MEEYILYGHKNLLTQVCEYVLRKMTIRKGFILVNCSKGLSKELRKQSMLM